MTPRRTIKTAKPKPPQTGQPTGEPTPKGISLRVDSDFHERLTRAQGKDLASGLLEGRSLQKWLVYFIETYLPQHEELQRRQGQHPHKPHP